jgi:hypothetical protein
MHRASPPVFREIIKFRSWFLLATKTLKEFPCLRYEDIMGVEVQLRLFFTLSLSGKQWLTSYHEHFVRKEHPVPVHWEAA